MDVSLLEQPDCQNGPIHISQFRCSPIEVRSNDPIRTNYKQGTDSCGHFTIRGYVADRRKKDAKICWPFVMLDHEARDEEFYKSMPHLHVVNFRRWNCKECLPKTLSSVLNGEVAISGESTNPSFHKVASFTSHENKVPSYNDANIAECHPSFCSPKWNSGSEANRVTEVSTVCEGDDPLKEDNNKLDECLFVENKLCELRLAEEDGNEDDALNITVALDHDISPHQKNCADQELIDSLQKASNGVSEENPVCKNDSIRHTELSKTGTVNEIHYTSINENEIPLRELQNGDILACYKDNINNNYTQSSVSDDTFDGQDYDNRVQSSSKRLQHKILPKIKLLSDIMRNAEHCKNQEIYLCNLDTQQTGTSKDGKPEASGEATHFQGQENSELLKTNDTSIQRSVGNECLENHDEGTFLVHWLKKSKKSFARKKRSKNRATHNTTCNMSASTSVIHQKKVIIDLNSVPCASRDEIEAEFPSKQNAAIRALDLVCQMLPKERTIRKGNKPENAPSKQVNVKSSGLETAERIQHYGIAVNACLKSKIVLSNNKGKTIMDENEKPLQTYFVEDSFPITNTRDSQKDRERMKKKKKLEMASICQEEVIDEFPMDIVELLARNQYERCLLDATMSTGAFNIVPERKEDMKIRDHSLVSDFSDSQQVMLSENMDEHVWQKFPQTSSTKYVPLTISGSSRHPILRTRHPLLRTRHAEVHKSVCLNEQKDAAGPSTGTSALSGFCDYSQLRIRSPNRNTCLNILKRQVPGSYEGNSENLGQASDRNMHNFFLDVSNGRPSGGRIQNTSIPLNPICNSINMIFRDPGLMKRVDRAPFVNNFGVSISSNLADKEDKNKLSMQKTGSDEPVSILESGKQQPANPLDLYNNDLTALQLLWMFDPAACSNKLCFQQPSIGCVPYSQESGCLKDLGPVSSRLEIGRTREADKYPYTIGSPYQSGSSSKPLRPRPRFGVLGRYLQKDIAARSTICETPFGSLTRCLSELTCPTIDAEAPAKNPQFGSLGGATTFQSIGFRHESLSSKSSNAEIIYGHSLVVNGTDGTAIQPVGQRKREFCVINRNPAEFAIIADDCEYMMTYDGPRHEAITPSSGLASPTYQRGHKRRKVMKLTDIQELLRS